MKAIEKWTHRSKNASFQFKVNAGKYKKTPINKVWKRIPKKVFSNNMFIPQKIYYQKKLIVFN